MAQAMKDESSVTVQIEGQEIEWKMTVEGDGPWHLSLSSASGVESSATADNAFDALRSIRADLAAKDVRICCNGARIDVRPSGLSASHGAWTVYVLHRWRPPTVRDLVPTFGYYDGNRIGSVAEQDSYWERHLKSRGNWFNFINPLWWAYFLTSSCGKPRRT
ncbi:hypothetical protein ABZY02_09440 [Streptomyces sp. NPDC006649]|uniref:hypothetical protein n=1 Tax=Streptomyces sp. NPDC006649 TaxID=3156896 RepID=UPI0033B60EC7